MTQSDKFINWLEGYLDASKNKLASSQIREIRKKIKEYHAHGESQYAIDLINNANSAFISNDSNKLIPLNEEFLKEVERNKSAATMDDLTPAP